MVLVNGARARRAAHDRAPGRLQPARGAPERARHGRGGRACSRKQEVMVSHIVFVADAKGKFAVVERAPGTRRLRAARLRRSGAGGRDEPLRGRPRGRSEERHRARAHDDARRGARASTRCSAALQPASVDGRRRSWACCAITRAPSGEACPLGDRRSDRRAHRDPRRRSPTRPIASSGSARARTSRAQFVTLRSEGDVRAPVTIPRQDAPPETIVPPIPSSTDGRYEEGRKHAGGPKIGGDGNEREATNVATSSRWRSAHRSRTRDARVRRRASTTSSRPSRRRAPTRQDAARPVHAGAHDRPHGAPRCARPARMYFAAPDRACAGSSPRPTRSSYWVAPEGLAYKGKHGQRAAARDRAHGAAARVICARCSAATRRAPRRASTCKEVADATGGRRVRGHAEAPSRDARCQTADLLARRRSRCARARRSCVFDEPQQDRHHVRRAASATCPSTRRCSCCVTAREAEKLAPPRPRALWRRARSTPSESCRATTTRGPRSAGATASTSRRTPSTTSATASASRCATGGRATSCTGTSPCAGASTAGSSSS